MQTKSLVAELQDPVTEHNREEAKETERTWRFWHIRGGRSGGRINQGVSFPRPLLLRVRYHEPAVGAETCPAVALRAPGEGRRSSAHRSAGTRADAKSGGAMCGATGGRSGDQGAAQGHGRHGCCSALEMQRGGRGSSGSRAAAPTRRGTPSTVSLRALLSQPTRRRRLSIPR